MDLHCTRCHIALPPESERCPRCLRTSTLVDRDLRRGAAELLFAEEPGESYVGMRVAVLAAAWTLAALASWLLLPQQEWLEPNRLWLAAIVWVGALWMLPLRAAFRAPRSQEGPREALRALVILTAQVVGLGSVFALIIAGICQLTDSLVLALMIGLALFVSAIVVAPALSAALRGEKPLAEVLPPALGKAGLAVLCIGGLMTLAVIKGERRREENTIHLPSPGAMSALHEISEIMNVPVRSARATPAGGTPEIHLSADAGTFDKSLARLKAASLAAIADLKAEGQPKAVIKLWLPARFESPNGRQARDEIKILSDALATPVSGAPTVTIEVAFGEPPR